MRGAQRALRYRTPTADVPWGHEYQSPPHGKIIHNYQDVPIIHAWYDVCRKWHELLLAFPKRERYTLGQTCETYCLSVLEQLLAAAGATQPAQKLERLREASVKLDALRLLVRLAKDNRCVTNNAYLDLESKLHEAGRMLGGWMKSLGPR